MADNATQFANQAQDATRSIFQAAQDGAGTQLKVVQRLSEIQQRVVRQAVEASQEQLQLAGKVRDPRAFASAQADLAKRYGQRYVENVQEAVDVVTEAWQDYGNRLQGTINTMRDKAQRAALSKRAA
jgi:phasin family protein